MKAMILAAGRGERMRPLTDKIPKPLLKVKDKTLIEYHIEKLRSIGLTEIVINHAYLGYKIEETLGNGSEFSVNIKYSPEPEGGLETAGGIAKALDLLSDTFIVVNGDVYSEFDYSRLLEIDLQDDYGCLCFVKNPSHNLKGDFGVENGRVVFSQNYTFSGIAIYKKEAFKNIPVDKLKLKPYFNEWVSKNLLQGIVIDDFWCDVGTPERLKQLDLRLREEK
jgi:MurNAc alpha-1-phosphate uridylyltransferase